MKNPRIFSLCACLLAMSTISASSSLVIYEPFDFGATGNLAGNGGALGTSGNWISTNTGGNVQQLTTGLSFSGLTTSGRSTGRTSYPQGAESHIAITGSAITALTQDNTSIYFSVLVRNERNSVSNENFAFVLGTGALAIPGSDKQNPTITGGEGFGIHLDGNTDGGNTIDILGYQIDGGVSSQSVGKVDNDSTVNTFMIAGRIDWVANGGNDTLTLYNIADTGAALPTAFATMSADLDQSLFDTLAMESHQRSIIDEIRFGTTWSDVGLTGVPEPSVAILSGFGTLLLLRRRK